MAPSQEAGPDVIGKRVHGGVGGVSPRGNGGARGSSGGEQVVERALPAQKEEEVVACCTHSVMTSRLLVTMDIGWCLRWHVQRAVKDRPDPAAEDGARNPK